MLWPLYFFLIYLMVAGLRLSSLWNAKSKLWIIGRKQWKTELLQLKNKTYTRLWFHVSSLGEFEQARPVIEELKRQDAKLEVILTFFSPSGFEIRKNYDLAQVLYLPADLPSYANYWVEHVKPDLAIFVKYDLWPGYLNALRKKEIPYVLISAHPRLDHFSSWSIPPTNGLLKKANAIFLQEGNLVDDLEGKGFHNLKVAGDTRIDRTVTIAETADDHIPEPLKLAGHFDLIAGSTWPEDEHLLIPVIEELKLKAILAPHDVSENNVNRLMKALGEQAIRYSTLKPNSPALPIIVLDTIGLLAYCYANGRIAYVGGGFGKGIHNILEPAAHRVPVIMGPKYHKFAEAGHLIRAGGAFSIKSVIELKEVVQSLLKSESNMAGKAAGLFLEKNKGATQKITSYIRESIPFGPR